MSASLVGLLISLPLDPKGFMDANGQKEGLQIAAVETAERQLLHAFHLCDTAALATAMTDDGMRWTSQAMDFVCL